MDFTSSQDPSSFDFPRIVAGSNPSHSCLPRGFSEIAERFEAATGWVLSYHETHAVKKTSSDFGKAFISDMSAAWPAKRPTISRRVCDRIAEAINSIFESRDSIQSKTRKDNLSSQDTIEILLKSACHILESDMAVVYLLDEQAQVLNRHFSVGVGEASEFRSIGDCQADQEALNGSFLSMKNSSEMAAWQSPFSRGSAICLPISHSSDVLGTLWINSEEQKDLGVEHISVLEMIAECISMQLEIDSILYSRGMEESASPATLKLNRDSQVSNESSWVQPPFAGWEFEPAEECGYVNWSVTSDEQLVAVVAASDDALVHEALTNHLQQLAAKVDCNPAAMMPEITEELGRSIDGAGLMVAVVDPLLGEVQLAQNGLGTLATFVESDGSSNCINCNFACFLTRGQALVLDCQMPRNGLGKSDARFPQLTISRG